MVEEHAVVDFPILETNALNTTLRVIWGLSKGDVWFYGHSVVRHLEHINLGFFAEFDRGLPFYNNNFRSHVKFMAVEVLSDLYPDRDRKILEEQVLEGYNSFK